MCKVMTLTNSSKIKNLEKFINTVRPLITSRDQDGFGWAAQGSKGIFGEKTTNVKTPYRLDSLAYAVKLPIVKRTYEAIGEKSKLSGSLILHGRTSTNVLGLVNTHPIQRDGWTLVHNGVVSNHGPEYTMQSENDTEHLAYWMANGGISKVEEHLSGYYAFAAFGPDSRLHVARDSKATLYIAWVSSIESYMVATTESLIKDTCAGMKWSHGPIDAIEDNIYMVFEGNKLVQHTEIKPRGYDAKEASLMSKSLHYLDDAPSASLASSFDSSDYAFRHETLETEDMAELFLEEVEQRVDSSYTIYDQNDRQIDFYDFIRMDEVQKLQCSLVRPDGSMISADFYEEPKVS